MLIVVVRGVQPNALLKCRTIEATKAVEGKNTYWRGLQKLRAVGQFAGLSGNVGVAEEEKNEERENVSLGHVFACVFEVFLRVFSFGNSPAALGKISPKQRQKGSR